MTPQEKAKELFDKYSSVSNKMADYSIIYGPTAKLHALISVYEMINELEGTNSTKEGLFFWQDVKQEIEKL